MTGRKDGFADIQRQVMWTRLLAVVEEQARSLMRTAFSATVSEAGDLSAGIFDTEGNLLAQAVTGTPGHVNSMAEAARNFLAVFPVETMREGDHYITNDPWLASGHLHDITMLSPAFRDGRPVALFACTCHQVDIGGLGQGPDGRSVYEEGLCIPPMALVRAGELNRDLLTLVRANVRQPYEVEGDILSYVTCNEVAARRLNAMLDEFPGVGFATLGAHILERSRAAMLAEVAKLPQGTWRNSMTIDGFDAPITLSVAVTIGPEGVHVAYEDVPPASRHGINLVLNYTKAYSAFGVRTAIAPDVPNNAGSLGPVTISAPLGSILNVERPRPVCARHIIGMFLPDVVLGALAQAMPDRIPAEGASCVWGIQLRGGPEIADDGNAGRKPFELIFFNSGGSGARPDKDGLDATAFPSGVRALPAEAVESLGPIVIWRKELRPDSGGAGQWRGGVGQTVEVGTLDGAAFAVFAMYDRVIHPARGRDDGGNGAPGSVTLDDGTRMRSMGKQVVPGGRRLCLDLPGGGAIGDPRRRTARAVASDVRTGLVSPAAALNDYGVMCDPDGVLDEAGTARTRSKTFS